MINIDIDIEQNEREKTEQLKNCVPKIAGNFIIIHDSFSTKDGNWFPWLKKQLESKEDIVDVPQMPIGTVNQNFENWTNILDDLKVNEKTTIIAHGIASVFVCKYLTTKKIKVKKLVFVCGFNNYHGKDSDLNEVNESMFMDNLEDIKNYCSNIICFYSDNDPYVKLEAEKEFADAIASEQYLIENGGHINTESGYIEFKEILDVL